MTQAQDKSINARDDESSGVKPKHAGGRHSKAYYNADVTEVLAGTAKEAARLLQAHVNQVKGHKANMKPSLQRACEYTIDHTIGKARQKVIISGGVLAYGELAKSAGDLDKKPRPVLADALEVAHKYQDKTPADDPGPGADSADKPPETTEKEGN